MMPVHLLYASSPWALIAAVHGVVAALAAINALRSLRRTRLTAPVPQPSPEEAALSRTIAAAIARADAARREAKWDLALARAAATWSHDEEDYGESFGESQSAHPSDCDLDWLETTSAPSSPHRAFFMGSPFHSQTCSDCGGPWPCSCHLTSAPFSSGSSFDW